MRARILAIACGYEDADDLDHLRTDPAFKLACSRLPDSGDDLCSQPTMSRWENAPNQREVMRIYCASYPAPPAAITFESTVAGNEVVNSRARAPIPARPRRSIRKAATACQGNAA